MAGRKRKTAGFSIGDRNYNITKNDDGSYELELGNWTDAGWHWDGDETDLVGVLIRLKSSNADTSQIEEHWDEIKKDALKNINHEDWFYMLSGDNSRWEFGNDNDYIYDTISSDLNDTEQWGELSEEVKDEVLDNNDIYPPTFAEFKEKEIEFSIQDMKHALSLDSFSEFSSEVNDIQENIETSFRESMDEKIYSLLDEQINNAKNKFSSDLDEDDDRYNPDYIGNPAPKEKSDYIGDVKHDKSYDENQMNMFSIRKIKSILIKESWDEDDEFEDDEFEDDEITPDYDNDAFIEDIPSGGYSVSSSGRYLGEVEYIKEGIKLINEHNGKNYFPAIYYVNERGTIDALDYNGNFIN